MTAKRRREGFTLVEVLIALALFALIGVAGFTLLNSVLRTQGATEARLDRMAEIQRAMLVVTSDLDQVTGSVAGGGGSLSIRKFDTGGAIVAVRYDVSGEDFTRTVTGPGGERIQTLVTGVSDARWTFHQRSGAVHSNWPPPQSGATLPSPSAPPGATRMVPDEGLAAIALDLTLTGINGRPGATVRRLVSIPLTDAPETVVQTGPGSAP
ncbi:MAG: prepilin-type N-terminal cleavage/methylation domain-containing protein [Caulobacteraceae bacterium]|nr:prepilin-type N-terminal cleavage/methylation domain-containing protein [Caulobacteraceae bacterium]